MSTRWEKKIKILKAITVRTPLSKELIYVPNFLNEVVTSLLLHWKDAIYRCPFQVLYLLYSHKTESFKSIHKSKNTVDI